VTIRLSRIALLLAATTVLTALGGVLATYFVAKDEFRDILDHDLKTQSKLLVEFVASGRISFSDPDIADLLEAVFEHEGEETIWVNIFDRTTGAHLSNLEHDLPVQQSASGDVHLQWNGHDWRGYQRTSGDLTVQLLRRDDGLDEVQDEIFEDIATPMLIASGINLLLLAALIGFTLHPVAKLGRQLANRSANSLSPVIVRTPAKEIVVLRDTLNHLIGEVESVLMRERQFANDVAHELRTPLTTLKLELVGMEPDVAVLKSEVDRLAQMVGQLLTLARVEQGFWRKHFSSIELHALCEQELRRAAPSLDSGNIEVGTDLNPATISGDSVLLEILIQNLISNVLRHCAAGTKLTVRLLQIDGQSVLQFIDNGRGIEAAMLRHLNGGLRALDSRGEGLGLGLSICRKIAEVHGATLTLRTNRDGTTGLTVEIVFAA
jgi:two-component system, OmpR family, sensor histidine kinase QseC